MNKLSKFIGSVIGARGRSIDIFDNKAVIKTDITIGSVITGNATDGEKTVFYIDCVGVQFKRSGTALAIGYLQLETSSMQMNNQNSNFFSENTFTYEEKPSSSNALMQEVYQYIVRRIEGYKYGFDENESYEPTNKLLTMLNQAQSVSDQAEAIIYFCEKCKDAYSGEPNTVRYCPECKRTLQETAVTRRTWRSMRDSQKEEMKKRWSKG